MEKEPKKQKRTAAKNLLFQKTWQGRVQGVNRIRWAASGARDGTLARRGLRLQRTDGWPYLYLANDYGPEDVGEGKRKRVRLNTTEPKL